LPPVADEPSGDATERQFFSVTSAEEIASIPRRFGDFAGLRVVREIAAEMTPATCCPFGVPDVQRLFRGLDELLTYGD
jgi:hypothetical protein